MSPETASQSPQLRESRFTARTIGHIAEGEYNTKLINILCYLRSWGFPQNFFNEREMSWLEKEDTIDSKVRIDALLYRGTRADWDKHFPGLSPFEDFEWRIIHEAQARYNVQRIILKHSEDNHHLVQENTRLKKTIAAMGVSTSIIILYLAYNLYREKNTSEESTPPRSKIRDTQEPLPEGTTFAVL